MDLDYGHCSKRERIIILSRNPVLLAVQVALEGVEAPCDARNVQRFVSQQERHVNAAHGFNGHLFVHKVVGVDARGKPGTDLAGLEWLVGYHEAPRVA